MGVSRDAVKRRGDQVKEDHSDSDDQREGEKLGENQPPAARVCRQNLSKCLLAEFDSDDPNPEDDRDDRQREADRQVGDITVRAQPPDKGRDQSQDKADRSGNQTPSGSRQRPDREEFGGGYDAAQSD